MWRGWSILCQNKEIRNTRSWGVRDLWVLTKYVRLSYYVDCRSCVWTQIRILGTNMIVPATHETSEFWTKKMVEERMECGFSGKLSLVYWNKKRWQERSWWVVNRWALERRSGQYMGCGSCREICIWCAERVTHVANGDMVGVRSRSGNKNDSTITYGPRIPESGQRQFVADQEIRPREQTWCVLDLRTSKNKKQPNLDTWS